MIRACLLFVIMMASMSACDSLVTIRDDVHAIRMKVTK